MLIIIISLICSALIILVSFFLKNKTTTSLNACNEDLNKFYSMFNEPVNVQLKQLILAAKSVIKRLNSLSKERETIVSLFEDRVLSDKFQKKYQDEEEELIIEKTIIENEAEQLKQGSQEQVFSEASKMVSYEMMGTKKKRIFDEGMFLKKRESLLKDLKNRVVAKVE